MLRSARPGTGYEVGREKRRAFQCRSNLSNLSNQIRKIEEKASLFLPNFLSEVHPAPQTTDEDFAPPGRTGWSGWTASMTAGITRVQPRDPEVDDGSAQVGRTLVSPPGPSGNCGRESWAFRRTATLVMFVVFRLRVGFRFPFNIRGIETGVVVVP
jgi:hypothetical protein